jgi:tetratricopeptide (TPR) repeat protein
MRLAELYSAIGQEKEAAEAYLSAAQRVLGRGDHAEAINLAERALKIDPNHTDALTLKARALAAAGRRADAAVLLEGLPNLESGSEATALLIEQYWQSGRSERAAALASKVFEHSKKHELAFKVSTALLDAGELDRALELLGQVRGAMIEAGEHERLAQALTSAADRLPGRLEPLEWLVELYDQTSDSFRLPDALAQLAEAAAAAGQLERAKQAYEQLLHRDPEDEPTRQRLNQVRARMGLEPLEEVAGARASFAGIPAGAPRIEASPAPPVVEPELDEDTQRYIAQALIDVDLFSSYGQTHKAIDLLETVLQRAPRHTTTLEKLLDLSLGAGNDRRTAELAGQLEQIHLERSDVDNAERFSELRRRFQRAAGLAEEEVAAAAQAARPAEFSLPTVDAEPVPLVEGQPVAEPEAEPVGEPMVHEVDLSGEWAALSQETGQTPSPPLTAAVSPEAVQGVELQAEASGGAPATEPPAEYELEMEPEEPAAEPATPAMSSEQVLSELATAFEGLAPQPPTPEISSPAAVEAAEPAPDRPQAGATEGVEPLREVFDEFRAELGELGAEEEDLETHYNLGIAYREMGLLEEAIGEFQKVAQASQKGRAFRYAMQCCTLLGLAFMEKGQPSIAAMWYERALQSPGLDQETSLALLYDLGVAQEVAGDEAAARKSFLQVYAMNIDYRDVAERIAALEKRR